VEIKKLGLQGEAYHILGEALSSLCDFYHRYADYLYRLAELNRAILESEEAKR